MQVRVCLGVFLLLLAGSTARAVLVQVNDPLIDGNFTYTRDGFNITRDTQSGLDWLDVTLSTGYSYNQVVEQLGDGRAFEGFHFAMEAELVVLFEHAGLDIDAHTPVEPAIELLDLVGISVESRGGGHIAGFFNDGDIDSSVGLATLIAPTGREERYNVIIWKNSRSSSQVSSITGSWLVRDTPTNVPEPAAFLMCTIGLFAAFLEDSEHRRAKQSTQGYVGREEG
jgi:hypothetical protein